jgi:hypothetical protein
MCTGKRVHVPSPRGKIGSIVIRSSSVLFPLLRMPTTTTLGGAQPSSASSLKPSLKSPRAPPMSRCS